MEVKNALRKRLIYFLDLPTSPNSGVAQKVMNQLRQWIQNDLDVEVYLVVPRSLQGEWEKALASGTKQIYSYRTLPGRIFCRQIALVKLCWHAKQSRAFVYLRLSIMTPFEICFLLMTKFFVEVNSDALEEFKFRRPLAAIVYPIIEGLLIKRAQGTIYVTKELELRYRNRYNVTNTEFVTNGVEFTEVSSKLEFKFDLVFIATETKPWHGVTIILSWAKSLPGLRFLLIGEGIQDLVNNYSEMGNVTIMKNIPAEEEKRILSSCVVGISSLNLSTLNMHEGSPLKTRTYLANGLPVIVGYDDIAFEKAKDAVLDVRNYEEDLLAAILTFLAKWRKKRVRQEDVQAIDIRVTELKRLNFIFNKGEKSHDRKVDLK